VSDGREQSYYEIALTNRQVMSIFVVLLVCLLTAFVSGVWIGKDGGGATVQTAEAEVISSGVRDGEKPLEQMDFFEPPAGSSGAAATGQVPQVEPHAGEQGSVEKSGVEKKPRPQRRVPKAEKSAKTPEVKPKVVSTQKEVFGEVPRVEPRQERATAQPADTSGATAPPGETFFIQVFSSNDEAQARSVVDRLKRGSYPARLSTADIDGRVMYRVRVGPYSERDGAQKVAQRVQKEYKLSTWITR